MLIPTEINAIIDLYVFVLLAIRENHSMHLLVTTNSSHAPVMMIMLHHKRCCVFHSII